MTLLLSPVLSCLSRCLGTQDPCHAEQVTTTLCCVCVSCKVFCHLVRLSYRNVPNKQWLYAVRVECAATGVCRFNSVLLNSGSILRSRFGSQKGGEPLKCLRRLNHEGYQQGNVHDVYTIARGLGATHIWTLVNPTNYYKCVLYGKYKINIIYIYIYNMLWHQQLV